VQHFQFRLDSVLDWYHKKCRMEENRLTACLGLVHATERKIKQLEVQREAIEREIFGRPAIPAADFVNLSRYRLRASKEAIDLNEDRRQRMVAAAEQRGRVQQAQQRVKLVEKMRDRRLAEYTAAAGRELENAAADAYLARWSAPNQLTHGGRSR
jgi:flagellar biosynthesis chaperone FliJ